jgi:signal transduction histidine kinase
MRQITRIFRPVKNNLSIVALSTAAMLVIITISAAVFVRSRTVMEQQLKERLRAIAAVAVEQFDADAVGAIKDPLPMDSPTLRIFVNQLQTIRSRIPEIEYAYIMRRTEDPMYLEFVADADTLSSFADNDVNSDGVLDPDEATSYPGDRYPIHDVPALQSEAFLRPSVDEEITHDQWGALISGYAPLVDNRGNTVAVLGIDMDAESFLILTRSIFSEVTFIFFVMIGLALAGMVVFVAHQRHVLTLRQIERERSALISLATHQLSAPLAVFRWWSEILQDEIKTKAEDDPFVEMQKATDRMNVIIQELHNANEMSKKERICKPEKASLKDLIQETIKEIEDKLKRKNQHILLKIDSAPIMRIDQKCVSGALEEILHNAMDFSPDGSTIAIETIKNKDSVTVAVHDEGCGVPDVDKDRIFDRFTRGSNAMLMKSAGSGIGLFITRNLIDHVGGTIQLKSRGSRKGSTFSFTLPIT